MNDIDDFLSSMGVQLSPREAPSSPQATSVEQQPQEESEPEPFIVQSVTVPQQPETTLTDSDFNDILSDIGFQETSEESLEEDWDGEEAEEVEETNEEVAVEAESVSPTEAVATFVDSTIDTPPESSTSPNPSAPSTTTGPLPLNSPTLLINDTTSRFSGAEWYSAIQQSSIILAGLGGIGSWCALQLARMNPANLYLFDADTVETVNLAGQLYSSQDVGITKVDAVFRMLQNYTTAPSVFAIHERFTADSPAAKIMMCGFDNMEARKTFFTVWKNYVEGLDEGERKECLYLDGRLSMDTLQVFCIQGSDNYNMQRYEREFLFSDAEAEETVCSMKQTTYLACMIGSIMVNLFTNFIANSLSPIMPYDLPFFTEYDAPNMLFKTQY